MSVMLQRDAQRQYLYLHNVAIEKEMMNSSKTHLVTTGVNEENKHLSMTIILPKAVDVKINKQNKVQKHAKILPVCVMLCPKRMEKLRIRA